MAFEIQSDPECGFQPSDNKPDRYMSTCPIEPWERSEQGYCILHADSDQKPPEIVSDVLTGQSHPISYAKLDNISDGTGFNFEGANLPRADFSGSTLEGVEFGDANLTESSFRNANLDRADFSGNTDLTKVDFRDTSCVMTDFSGADIQQSTFDTSTLIDVDLSRVQGHKSSFRNCTLTEVKLFTSKFDKAEFAEATLRDCQFQASDLSESSFVNSNIFGTVFIDSNLREVRFNGAELGQENNFGSRSVLEYQADRLAEPDAVLRRLNLPRVEEREFGKKAERNPSSRFSEKDTDSSEPPQSPFEKCYDWSLWWIIIRLLSLPRVAHRVRIRFRVYKIRFCGGSLSMKHRQELDLLNDASRIYAEIKTAYRGSAETKGAQKFNIREKEAQRKQFALLSTWPRNFTLKRLMMYGEKPLYIIRAMLMISIISTVVILCLGVRINESTTISVWNDGPLQIWTIAEIFLFSVQELLSLPTGSMVIQTGDKAIVNFLSIIGRLLEAAFIFTLGRRAVS